VERKKVLCICHECGIEYKTRKDNMERGRKRRGDSIDLCKECSCKVKYRKTVMTLRGSEHIRWKGGIQYKGGYKKIYVGNKKYKGEHRIVVEEKIKRKLSSKEHIHHIDLDKLNNDINNLYICNGKKHVNIHFSSMQIGFFLIGKKIWFDYEFNIYVSEERKINYLDIDMSEYEGVKINERIRKNRLIYKCFYFGPGNIKMVHTAVAEKIIKRKLYSDECVHHIDGDTENNSPENLKVLSRKGHRKAHNSLIDCVAGLYKKGIVKFKEGVYYV